MAPDTTPKAWPAQSRGLLDDAGDFIRRAIRTCFAAAAKMRRDREALRDLELRSDLKTLEENLNGRFLQDIGLGDGPARRLGPGAQTDASGEAGSVGAGAPGPRARVSATLARGQCLALDGSSPATVECLTGAAWITCPTEGRDVQLRAGQTARIEEPGDVVVAALGGPARIRMAWS